jgi:hypothetical protein
MSGPATEARPHWGAVRTTLADRSRELETTAAHSSHLRVETAAARLRTSR